RRPCLSSRRFLLQCSVGAAEVPSPATGVGAGLAPGGAAEMTEREWLTCEDPDGMLRYLGAGPGVPLRRLWAWLTRGGPGAQRRRRGGRREIPRSPQSRFPAACR